VAKVLRDVQLGMPLPDERQTVGQFLERWLEQKRSQLRPRAWLTYEQAVRLHLAPEDLRQHVADIAQRGEAVSAAVRARDRCVLGAGG